MFKLKTSKHQATTRSFHSSTNMKFQYGFCFPNRLVLLIQSLLCIIIILTEQAVAFNIQPTTTQTTTAAVALLPSNNSLVEILPHDNVSSTRNSKLLAVLKQEHSFNRQPMKGLTSGQRVINAVPEKERTDFIMYQLTIALKKTYDYTTQQHLFQNLDDLEKFYKNKLTNLKVVPVYENFSIDLLHWVGQEFQLSHQNVFAQLRSRTEIWCTPQGICYGYGTGMGCYCCPF